MLGRLVLLVLQLAILVWLVGVLGAVVLKDVAQPSAATLTATLIGALLLAGATLFPALTKAITGGAKALPLLAYPLVGAVLGYLVKR